MDALDGNAIAGELFECYGREMTTAMGACAHCGAVSAMAELMVYGRAPGAVARCRSCGSVVMVLVRVRGEARVHADGLRLLDSPGSARPPDTD
jgi:hypothetical protein